MMAIIEEALYRRGMGVAARNVVAIGLSRPSLGLVDGVATYSVKHHDEKQ